MANVNASLFIPSRNDRISHPFMLRIGPRSLWLSKDFRSRYYLVNPVIEFRAGLEAGHLEILFLRKWLLVFSKAR